MFIKLFEDFVKPMSAEEIKSLVTDEMIKVTSNDWTKLIGRCSEASLLSFRILKQHGQDAVAIDGKYLGTVSQSSKEYFRGDRHSWTVCNGFIVDPTRWVFDWENIDPYVEVIPDGNKDYVATFKPISDWEDWWEKELRYAGFKI